MHFVVDFRKKNFQANSPAALGRAFEQIYAPAGDAMQRMVFGLNRNTNAPSCPLGIILPSSPLVSNVSADLIEESPLLDLQ